MKLILFSLILSTFVPFLLSHFIQFIVFSFFFGFFSFAEMFGTRHFVTFMLFLGMANAYVMRTNMSVAIVAMVNHTYVGAQHKEVLDDECPNYINTTSSVSGWIFFCTKKQTNKKKHSSSTFSASRVHVMRV